MVVTHTHAKGQEFKQTDKWTNAIALPTSCAKAVINNICQIMAQ